MFSLKTSLLALVFVSIAVVSSIVLVLSSNYIFSIIAFSVMILTIFSLWYFFSFFERTEIAEKLVLHLFL
jgi:hypothetical protein